MNCKSRALVLGAFSYGEGGKIFRVFTEAEGRRSFIQNSLRGKTAGFKASMARPMSLVEITWREKDPDSLHRATEVTWSNPHERLWNHPAKALMLMLMAEVVEKTYRQEQADPEKFALLENTLVAWETAEPRGLILSFLIQWCQALGWGFESSAGSYLDLLEGRFCLSIPEHKHYADGPVAQHIKNTLENRPDDAPGSIRFSAIQAMCDFLQLHTESRNGFNGLEVIQALY